MILRRLANAIREQRWFTVIIEFVIVVAGIFVGLQVDGWNQAQKDRVLEQKYLVRLTEDIQTDIDNFRDLEQIFETKAMTILSLRDIPVSKLLVVAPDDFMRNLDYTAWIALPATRSATFAELESSGRLALIQNLQLRNALSGFYANYELISDILAEPVGDYRRLLYEAIPGELYFKWRLSDEIGEMDRIEQSLQELQALPHFQAAANAEIAYATAMIYWLRLHRERAQDILEILQNGVSGEIDSG